MGLPNALILILLQVDINTGRLLETQVANCLRSQKSRKVGLRYAFFSRKDETLPMSYDVGEGMVIHFFGRQTAFQLARQCIWLLCWFAETNFSLQNQHSCERSVACLVEFWSLIQCYQRKSLLSKQLQDSTLQESECGDKVPQRPARLGSQSVPSLTVHPRDHPVHVPRKTTYYPVMTVMEAHSPCLIARLSCC